MTFGHQQITLHSTQPQYYPTHGLWRYFASLRILKDHFTSLKTDKKHPGPDFLGTGINTEGVRGRPDMNG